MQRPLISKATNIYNRTIIHFMAVCNYHVLRCLLERLHTLCCRVEVKITPNMQMQAQRGRRGIAQTRTEAPR